MDTFPNYLDRFFAPVAECLTDESAERLAHLQADEQVQARIEELADKSTEGELTDEERAEYESYVRASNLIGVLQAKAREKLARRASS